MYLIIKVFNNGVEFVRFVTVWVIRFVRFMSATDFKINRRRSNNSLGVSVIKLVRGY